MNTVHLHRGSNRRFIAQSRQHGCRKWQTVLDSSSYRAALQAAARAIEQGAKRSRVLFESDYYDPHILTEMRRVG